MAEHAADSDRGAADRPSSPDEEKGDNTQSASLGGTLRSAGVPELLEAQRTLQAEAAAEDLAGDVADRGAGMLSVPRPVSKAPIPPPAPRGKPADSSPAEAPEAASGKRPLPPPRSKREDEGADPPNADRTPDTPSITSSPGAMLGAAEAALVEQELELAEELLEEEPSDPGTAELERLSDADLLESEGDPSEPAESEPERLSDADLLEGEEELLEGEEELLESEEELLEFEAEADREQEARAEKSASEPEQELADDDLEEAEDLLEPGEQPASGPPGIPALSGTKEASDATRPDVDGDAVRKETQKRRPRSTLRIPDDAIPATPAPPAVGPSAPSPSPTGSADDSAEASEPATTGVWTRAPSQTLRPAAAAPPGPPPTRSADSPRPASVVTDAGGGGGHVTKSGTLVMASVPEPATPPSATPQPEGTTPFPPEELAAAEFIAVDEDEDDEDGRPTTLPDQPRRPAGLAEARPVDHEAGARSEPPVAPPRPEATPPPAVAKAAPERDGAELEEVEAEPLPEDADDEPQGDAEAHVGGDEPGPEAEQQGTVDAPVRAPDDQSPKSPAAPPPNGVEPETVDAQLARAPRLNRTAKPQIRTADEAPISQPPPVSSRPSAPSGVVADAHAVGLILPVFVSSDLPPVESQRGRRIAPPRRPGRDGQEVDSLEEIEPEAEITVPDGRLPRRDLPVPEAAPTTEAGSAPNRRPPPPPRSVADDGAGIDVEVDVDGAEAEPAAVPAPPPVPPPPLFEAAPEGAPAASERTPPPAEAKPASDVKPPTAPKAPKRKKPWWSELFEEDFAKTHDQPVEKDVLREADFIERVLNLAKGARVLDLGCGLGRHAAELAARGYEVVGVDHSNMMLAKATEHAAARGVTVNLVKGDMRKLNLDAVFDGIYCWSQTFGYFDEQTNHAVLESIHRALRQGGTFALDVSNRDFIAPRSPTMVWFERPGCVCMDEMKFDFYTSRMIVKRTVLFETGRSREIEFSMRLYSLHEIGRMLHGCGFRVLEVSGHRAHPGTYFGSESPRIIVAAERT